MNTYCRQIAVVVIALSVTVADTGCSRPAKNGNSPGGATKGSAGSISVKGSDTMTPLVTAWAEAYMAKEKSADIAVTGGGSGTGIAALINGSTDVCMASRAMQDEEKNAATGKGLSVKEIKVANDGIAVIVNPQNPISELTMDQVALLYTGAAKNWKDVGGADHAVIAVSRESSSGTYVFFQEHVLKKKDFSKDAMRLNANAAIVQSVAADAGAIGYVGLEFAAGAKNKVKTLAISKGEGQSPIVPSNATVLDGTYPVARPLFFYTPGDRSALAAKFIAWCVRDEGQKLAADNGYVPIK